MVNRTNLKTKGTALGVYENLGYDEAANVVLNQLEALGFIRVTRTGIVLTEIGVGLSTLFNAFNPGYIARLFTAFNPNYVGAAGDVAGSFTGVAPWAGKTAGSLSTGTYAKAKRRT